MSEDDAETAAAFISLTIVQARLIAFAELARNIQAQAGALAFGGEEWLEDILQLFGRHSQAVVEYLEHRQVTGLVAKHAQPYLFAVLEEDYPFLSASDVVRIGRAYGTRAVDWLGDAKSWDDLGRAFGSGLSEAEVNYLREKDWALTADDILWRRSKLGLHMSEAEVAALKEYMGG